MTLKRVKHDGDEEEKCNERQKLSVNLILIVI
jgi:hypothetical protein